ncbi:hypothetical protein [Chromatocurvus halotolerans]|uniref:Uncharacterized protein n=1 Tax=Chromatocurvus halotolerans TaxID=1132028 RepID=A0A4V2SC79_9GAMM|nr:hypothetical protein [Chromatocurvus halotolerans]TCO78390.1 hypothetical protein EV688_101207 [Chromatocurvus halotolerans]
MLDTSTLRGTVSATWPAGEGIVSLLWRCQPLMQACSLVVLLSACAGTTRQPLSGPTAAPVEACTRLFESVEDRVKTAGVARSFPHRISGFPYLRTTRTLASFRKDVATDAAVNAWLEHLAAADAAASRSELAQLDGIGNRELLLLAAETARRSGLTIGAETATTLDECRAVLVAQDSADVARIERLKKIILPDDDYSLVQRIGGLYPLTSLGVRAGVAQWHEEVRERYAGPARATAIAGERRRYGPAMPADAGDPVPIARDVLGIPRPEAAQLDALFRRHAPVWEIDTASAADIPGTPVWRDGDAGPGVDTAAAVVYRYTSITRFRGSPRLQLNYLAWFDERPASGPLDMLAGRLDGVIWRVTVDDAGVPLVYDSVHACGCYHLLFPVGDVALRSAAVQLPEPPLVPLTLEEPAIGTRVHLYLSAGAHYLEGVTHAVPDAGMTQYRFADREALYQTPVAGGGYRSLFREDGLIDGTQRGERWFLWPTGVRSPGAMRERGRRATAFIGRRHFDDAFLLDELFH